MENVSFFFCCCHFALIFGTFTLQFWKASGIALTQRNDNKIVDLTMIGDENRFLPEPIEKKNRLESVWHRFVDVTTSSFLDDERSIAAEPHFSSAYAHMHAFSVRYVCRLFIFAVDKCSCTRHFAWEFQHIDSANCQSKNAHHFVAPFVHFLVLLVDSIWYSLLFYFFRFSFRLFCSPFLVENGPLSCMLNYHFYMPVKSVRFFCFHFLCLWLRIAFCMRLS